MKSSAPESQLRRILGLSREYLTSWVVAGAIITLTGFSPDLWVAAILDRLAIRENFSLRGLPSFDIRIGLVAIGIAIIAWDVLRRNYSKHDALLNGPADIPTPVPPAGRPGVVLRQGQRGVVGVGAPLRSASH